MKFVYVCHPFSGDPDNNRLKVAKICRCLVRMGIMPIAPQLYLPNFVDDENERALAMRLCRELLLRCDTIAICGAEITAGMKEEIAVAAKMGIPAERIDLVEGISGLTSTRKVDA